MNQAILREGFYRSWLESGSYSWSRSGSQSQSWSQSRSRSRSWSWSGSRSGSHSWSWSRSESGSWSWSRSRSWSGLESKSRNKICWYCGKILKIKIIFDNIPPGDKKCERCGRVNIIQNSKKIIQSQK